MLVNPIAVSSAWRGWRIRDSAEEHRWPSGLDRSQYQTHRLAKIFRRLHCHIRLAGSLMWVALGLPSTVAGTS